MFRIPSPVASVASFFFFFFYSAPISLSRSRVRTDIPPRLIAGTRRRKKNALRVLCTAPSGTSEGQSEMRKNNEAAEGGTP